MEIAFGWQYPPKIYMPVFKSLQILLPPIEEQKRIEDTTKSFDYFQSLINAKIDKNIALKNLWMQIFSGRKTVSVWWEVMGAYF